MSRRDPVGPLALLQLNVSGLCSVQMIPESIHSYLSRIGRKGGLKSRRVLSSSHARTMVAVRLARQAFRDYRAQCFWAYRDADVTAKDVPWVVTQLRRNGNLRAWKKAARIQSLLCH
jgi:hypothetical protein